jgi:lipopolysaccharide transport system ATP-binding protein
LLRVLAGVYTATAGTIWTEGDVAGLFEFGGAVGRSLTGRECARRVLSLQGLDGARLAQVVDEVGEFAELASEYGQPVYTYSSGMTARLHFAIATALQHAVYLIDEILAAGDEHFRNKCWARMRERLSHGASGIVATHDWAALLKLCETTHIMDRGRIVASGPTWQIVRQYLDLPRFPATVARFLDEDPLRYVAASGEDAELVFRVELRESVPVVLGFSVEALRVGGGWEILLLVNNLPVASAAGRYEVALRIPRLPLAPGHYLLNLFLNAPGGPEIGRIGPAYDVRGWTYGNPGELVVTGAPRASVLAMPLEWRRVG